MSRMDGKGVGLEDVDGRGRGPPAGTLRLLLLPRIQYPPARNLLVQFEGGHIIAIRVWIGQE
jgi:hypothetical protein